MFALHFEHAMMHTCMSGLGEAYAHKAAWCFVLCGDFWKKWKRCLNTVREQGTEPIACNIYGYMQTRLCVETNMHVYRWRKASFFWIRNALDTGDECIYEWRQKRLALETNTPYSRDELIENVCLLYLAFDQKCNCI